MVWLILKMVPELQIWDLDAGNITSDVSVNEVFYFLLSYWEKMRRLFPMKINANSWMAPAALERDLVFPIHSRMPVPIRQQNCVHRSHSVFWCIYPFQQDQVDSINTQKIPWVSSRYCETRRILWRKMDLNQKRLVCLKIIKGATIVHHE